MQEEPFEHIEVTIAGEPCFRAEKGSDTGEFGGVKNPHFDKPIRFGVCVRCGGEAPLARFSCYECLPEYVSLKAYPVPYIGP